MAHSDTNEQFLRKATSWQSGRCTTISPIGQTVQQYLQDRSGIFRKNKAVIDIWNDVVPVGMRSHCTIAGIESGILTVEVDPGPYMHEMRIISNELLPILQDRCSQSGVRKIMLRPRSRPIEENPEEQV